MLLAWEITLPCLPYSLVHLLKVCTSSNVLHHYILCAAFPSRSGQLLLLGTVPQLWWLREKAGSVLLGEKALSRVAVTALRWQGCRKIPLNRFFLKKFLLGIIKLVYIYTY